MVEAEDPVPESDGVGAGVAAGAGVALEDVSDFDELDEPLLSVLQKPPPLKVTPTGRKTFFTGCTLPSTGWTASVNGSSVNDC